MAQLVFVHGRSQQGKDSVALKAQWVSALERGLEGSQSALNLSDANIRFPYYGDTLDQLVHDVPDNEVADVIVRGTEGDVEQEQFFFAVIDGIRRDLGISDQAVQDAQDPEVLQRGLLNHEWVQGILRAIDNHVPGGSRLSLALATRDVYQYLRNPGIRQVIDDGVRKALTPGVPTVVVAHSLGTVVAYRVLREFGAANGWDVRLLVTVGSPLGIKEIRKALAPIGYPACAQRWANAYDDRDVVALYPLDQNHFPVHPKMIVNKSDVRNPTDNRHGIDGYLSDPVVAEWIAGMLAEI